MLNKLKELYLKQQFEPSLLGLFINPFYFARKGLYQNIIKLAKNIKGKTLDVGCGQKAYEKFCNSSEYVGLEIDTPKNKKLKKADYFYDGKIFPFNDSEFDSIIIIQVFEHVFNPEEFLSEVNRVLKMGGVMLITVPFLWDEHEQPFDYARYSSFGLKFILKKSGFEIVESRKSMNDIRVIFQILNDYIYKKTITKNAYINLLLTIILMAPFSIIGEILSKILPKNNDLYLDNIVLAKKKKNV
ncbi:MAG: class I SAM-dependent methyltransferase [Candidatus Atribacteria bacterium]